MYVFLCHQGENELVDCVCLPYHLSVNEPLFYFLSFSLPASLLASFCTLASTLSFPSSATFALFKPAKVEVFWWREKKTALRLAFESSVLQREKELGK